MKHAAVAIAVIVAAVFAARVAPRAQTAAPAHDTFYFIGEINKASIVMLGRTIASGDGMGASPAQSPPDRAGFARQAFAALIADAGTGR